MPPTDSMEELQSFLQGLDLEHCMHEMSIRGITSMAQLAVVSSHSDLRLLAPSLATDEHTFHFLKLFKAIQAHNGNVRVSGGDGQRKKSGTAGCGEIPWVNLSEEYVDLAASTEFTLPTVVVQMGLQLQGILMMRKGMKYKMKNAIWMKALIATGTTFVAPQDPDLIEPSLNILFPQQVKVAGFIGWSNALTDWFQNVRNGGTKPMIPVNTDCLPFIEFMEYRPPAKKKEVKEVAKYIGVDASVQASIVNTLAGPDGYVKKSMLAIIEQLEQRALLNPFLGGEVKQYLQDTQEQASRRGLEKEQAKKAQPKRKKRKVVEEEQETEEEEEEDSQSSDEEDKEEEEEETPRAKRKRKRDLPPIPQPAKTTGTGTNVPPPAFSQPKIEDVIRAVPVPRAGGLASSYRNEQPAGDLEAAAQAALKTAQAAQQAADDAQKALEAARKAARPAAAAPAPEAAGPAAAAPDPEAAGQEEENKRKREQQQEEQNKKKQQEQQRKKEQDAMAEEQNKKKQQEQQKKKEQDAMAQAKRDAMAQAKREDEKKSKEENKRQKAQEKQRLAAEKEAATLLQSNYEKQTGYKLSKYVSHCNARLKRKRSNVTTSEAAANLHQSVVSFEYEEAGASRAALAIVTTGHAATTRMPERVELHWLQRHSDNIWVIDIGYNGFQADIETVLKCEKHKSKCVHTGYWEVEKKDVVVAAVRYDTSQVEEAD